MTKETIVSNLSSSHRQFVELISSLNEEEFMFSFNNKWTAGQHLEHICLAVSALAKGLILPAFLIKMFFGKANRPSKDYDGLVKKYHDKLEAGGVASGPYIPKPVQFVEREKLQRKLLSTVARLCSHVKSFSESQLDDCILPHPLLGKVTLREMLYFTHYHVQHHQNLVLQAIEMRV